MISNIYFNIDVKFILLLPNKDSFKINLQENFFKRTNLLYSHKLVDIY